MFKQSGGKEMVKFSFLLLVFLVIFGCTHAIPMKGTMEVPPTINKIPMRIGVFYSQEFRNYQHAGTRGGDRWDFPLGSVSVPLFDQAFASLFNSVESVPSLPPLSGYPGLKAVIAPKIEAFDFRIPLIKTGTYTAEITYRFTLYSLKGDPIASWTTKGIGEKSGQVGFEFARWPGEAADLATRDAVTKFLNGFPDVPEIRRWLQETKGSAN